MLDYSLWFAAVVALLALVFAGAFVRRIDNGAGMLYAYLGAVILAIVSLELSDSPQRNFFAALVIPATLGGCLYSAELKQLALRLVRT